MTAFIDSFTTQQLLPPWVSTGGQFWSFVVQVPPHCVQDYLDTHFNAPGPDQAPFHYSAIEGEAAGLGLLTVCDHTHFASKSLGSDWNALQHREVYWSVPAMRQRITPDNLLVDPQVVWVQPFAFDDNSSVLFAGREILGTEFEMGQILLKEGNGPGDLHIDVAVQGFQKFSPSAHAQMVPVLHARLSDPGKSDDFDTSWLRVYYEFIELSRPGAAAASTGAAPRIDAPVKEIPSLPVRHELNTLKQFRDVFDMRFAAYRALIASTSTYGPWRDVTIYEGKHVALDFMWSDSLAEKFERLFGLKLPAEPVFGHPEHEGTAEAIDWHLPRIEVPVKFAFSFTADVTFAVTETLHVYGQPGI